MSEVTLSWEAPWSYQGSVDDASDINGSFWFQMVIFLSAITLWIVVVVKSSTSVPKTDKLVEYVIESKCPQAAYQPAKYFWAFEPRIIVTRTTVSLIVAISTVELLVFNAIANYAGKGIINASTALLLLFTGIIFHFYTMTHKFMKTGELAARNKFYGLTSLLVLLLASGVFLCYLSYTETFGEKNDKGVSNSFFFGAILVSLSMLLMCITPLSDALKPFKYKKSSDESEERTASISLLLSGEYYMSFSIIDCFVIWTSLTVFILLEGYFISQAMTNQYAVPFIFLQAIPIYGFSLTIITIALSPGSSKIPPVVFNIVLFLLMSFCFAASMLHVCGIPGVNAACATFIPHKVFYTNVLVCGPFAILLFFISMGLVNSTFAPSFLVSRECVEER